MGMMEAVRPDLFGLDITAANGTPFRVLVIPPGVAGPNPYRAPAKDRDNAMVEFYDRRFPINGEHGQFTGGYYDVGAMLTHRAGLALHGSDTAWMVDARSMAIIERWLDSLRLSGELNRR